MENISWQERLKDKKKRRFFTKFLSYEDIELLDDTFGVQFNFNSYYPSDEAVEVNGGEIHITDISSISHQIDGGDWMYISLYRNGSFDVFKEHDWGNSAFYEKFFNPSTQEEFDEIFEEFILEFKWGNND